MLSNTEQLVTLTRQLLPPGRAFQFPKDGVTDKYMNAVCSVEAQLVDDALSFIDSLLPDNENFTADDATAWERRLGIYSSAAVPLADRKLAIARKYAHPGNTKPRQHYLYIESQLQAAGFDVYVYENRFDDGMGGIISKSPNEVLTVTPTDAAFHGGFRHGQQDHGDRTAFKVANSINERIDSRFRIGPDYSNTFFIGGATLGSRADVLTARKLEFRQLILTLKPLHTVALLFVNYT